MFDYILLSVFVVATAIQLYIWIFIFGKLARYAQRRTPLHDNGEVSDAVSIIICARNEAANLKKNLSRILTQNYHSFEVIVVNDQSTDETEHILENYIKKSHNLRVISVERKPPGSGKKPALARGIQAAKNEVLLFTDADCHPASDQWLREMQSHVRGSIEIGLGYGPYEKAPGFLNLFIRYETFFTALQYFSFALAGFPYMGVGRNLIYKKKLFHQTGGFKSHEHIMSGDDDLFINQVATSSNTCIVLDEKTHVYSAPATTWSAYYRQKSRHISTGKHYQPTHQFLLGLVSSSHFFHYISGFFLLILKISTMFAVVLIVTRILVILLICRPILRKLQDRSLTLWTPGLDAVYVLFYLIFSISLIKGKIKQWT